MPRSIMWFRRDLRLADNPALAEAAGDGDVVPVFVVDPAFARAGRPRRAFLARSLLSLDASMDGALVVRHGDPLDVIPRLAEEVGASAVLAAGDFAPYGRRRDAAVAERLTRDGRQLGLVGSPYAVDPGIVRKDDGSPYAVFSPFSRAWSRLADDSPIDEPTGVRWVGTPGAGDDDPLAGQLNEPPLDADLPAAGEWAAHEALDAFVAGGLGEYDEQRNRPGVPGTSRLSPYLRWGALHPRQLLSRLGTQKPHEVFRAELGWREFYADVLFHHPATGRENLKGAMDRIAVDTGHEAARRFGAWGRGETGYPIVDAGMRQLLATGWMHNRVRMITASFLVKDLHLPWQWGARHFMQHLVDGDLASNSHGWQWVAGTGTDAAPYFRIFNPTTQGQRFDADGSYVRRWVPELAHLSDKDLHAPSQSKQGVPLGYVPPIVDHVAEREEALRRYAAVTGR
jgi:deoxyribodipyrimidine photo-lyase